MDVQRRRAFYAHQHGDDSSYWVSEQTLVVMAGKSYMMHGWKGQHLSRVELFGHTWMGMPVYVGTETLETIGVMDLMEMLDDAPIEVPASRHVELLPGDVRAAAKD